MGKIALCKMTLEKMALVKLASGKMELANSHVVDPFKANNKILNERRVVASEGGVGC